VDLSFDIRCKAFFKHKESNPLNQHHLGYIIAVPAITEVKEGEEKTMTKAAGLRSSKARNSRNFTS